jgi:hypothetical protein
VEASDVVPVDVRCERDHRLVDQISELVLHRSDADARVDHQIAIPPAHVPDVAANQRMDVWLPQPRDVVLERPPLEPTIRDAHAR